MSETFPIKVDNNEAILQLTPVLDMSAADELLMALQNGVAHHQSLTLDAADVDRVSTPCMQVILAASIKIEKAGGVFAISNVSPGFERGIRELGLTDYLNKWSNN